MLRDKGVIAPEGLKTSHFALRDLCYKAIKGKVVGRIVSSVTITNIIDPSQSLRCDALVDTGASFMVLPTAWKDRLGALEAIETINLETANQEIITDEVCGPVRIQIEGFRPIFNEVLFVEMKPEDGIYEPLIGYIVLEQSQSGVDMLGHRLIAIKHMDLKSLG